MTWLLLKTLTYFGISCNSRNCSLLPLYKLLSFVILSLISSCIFHPFIFKFSSLPTNFSFHFYYMLSFLPNTMNLLYCIYINLYSNYIRWKFWYVIISSKEARLSIYSAGAYSYRNYLSCPKTEDYEWVNGLKIYFYRLLNYS